MADRPTQPVSESIHQTRNKNAKYDSVNSIIGNPGFPVINEKILFSLDHESQMTFRQVCQSWREQVDQPVYWIKKHNLISHPNKLGNMWIDLVGRIQKGSYLEKEVIECLMKWYGKFYIEDALKGMLPTHIAARFGYINIVTFFASYLENVNAPCPDGRTPLEISARYGSTEIFKFLAPLEAKPNAPCPDGWTPLHIAAQYGSTEIFIFLAPQVKNPNAPDPDGWTPLQSAAQFGNTEIFKFLAPQV